MLNAIWTAATNGDLQAQAGVLRLEERRAKLLGLDAPKQIEDVRFFRFSSAASIRLSIYQARDVASDAG
jgi:hypothetical protein